MTTHHTLGWCLQVLHREMGEGEVMVVMVVMTTQVLIGVTLGDTILRVIGPISFCPKQTSCQSLPCDVQSGARDLARSGRDLGCWR